MKLIFAFAGTAVLAAITASAQDSQADKLDKVKLELQTLVEKSRIVGAGGGIMGRTVKGAPYSGLEINESNQVLADGTRIHNENRTTVYRDSEGRVRRENGDIVTIWDAVANVSYTLDTKSMTAHKSTMATAVFMRQPVAAGAVATGGFFSAAVPANRVTTQDGMVVVTRDGKTEKLPMPADGNWVSDDGKFHAIIKQQTDTAGVRHGDFTVTQTQIAGESGVVNVMTAGAPLPEKLAAEMKVRARLAPPNMQELGDEVIEGVKSHGTRSTTTIEAGAIGNDRPLTTISERWYSDELQTEILNKRTDPRSGENTFRLINVNRSEPAAYLFQIPNGYNLIERK